MTLLNNKKFCKASDFHFLGKGGVVGDGNQVVSHRSLQYYLLVEHLVIFAFNLGVQAIKSLKKISVSLLVNEVCQHYCKKNFFFFKNIL